MTGLDGVGRRERGEFAVASAAGRRGAWFSCGAGLRREGVVLRDAPCAGRSGQGWLGGCWAGDGSGLWGERAHCRAGPAGGSSGGEGRRGVDIIGGMACW